MINKILETLKFENNKNWDRYNFNGRPVPRVTEIISSCIHEDYLLKWANYLGFKRKSYVEALNDAANIGTVAHNSIEKYLTKKEESSTNICFLGFMQWWNMISTNNEIEILSIEKRLVCAYFGGTLDALISINGKTYIIDYKTSNYVTYKHFVQLAAYRYMLRNVENIEVDGVIILQLNKDSAGFTEYPLVFTNTDNLSFMNQCENAFLSMVYFYFQLTNIKTQFKEVFKK